MHSYLLPLHAEFKRHANEAHALAMKAYMKDRFPFFGIKTPERRALMKEHMAIEEKILLSEDVLRDDLVPREYFGG